MNIKEFEWSGHCVKENRSTFGGRRFCGSTCGKPWRSTRSRLAVITTVFLAFAATGFVRAADRTWIGGNANWDSAVGRWSPADEPDPDDVAIFNTSDVVNLAMDNSVLGLTLSGGIDLNTSGYNLDVDGEVQLSGASTILIVGGSDSLLTADRITLNSGSTLRLNGGTVVLNEESGTALFDINANGTLGGNGVVNLTDAVASGATLFVVDGTISAASTVPGDLLGISAATLTIAATDLDARIDLDGAAEAGVVNVGVNDTLEVNIALADIFNGTINLSQGSTLRMIAPWQVGGGSRINANTLSLISGNPGPAATIAGAAVTQLSGMIVLDAEDSLRFSAPFTSNGGTISNAGHIIFNAECTISDGANLLMVGNVASITVNTNAVVNISDPDFNLDGGGFPGNVVTIHSGGVLDLDLGAGADESLSGTINLNGGELNVTTLDNNWGINGIVNVGANTGISRISGEEVTITGATLTVGTNSTLELNAPRIWTGTANLVLNAGTFRSLGATDFAGILTVGAAGESALRVGSAFAFGNSSATTLNGNLQLDNPTTVVQPGAVFSGNAALINRPGRVLRLLDGIASGSLNVLIQNEGTLQLGALNTDAQVGGASFQQTSSGALQIDIGGTDLNAFDRFSLTGAATLSGELRLSLIGGFVPAPGQTFDILTASAITGKFTKVNQPAGMPAGTAFSVSYSPTAVRLTVTTPYEAWINSFESLTNVADKLKTADPDNDDQNNLVEFALDGDPTNALATGKVVVKVAPISGVEALTLTLPVRTGTTLDPSDPAGGPVVLKHAGDAVSYSIEASEELTNSSWTLDATEVIGADATSIQSGLPVLSTGWVYRTLRSPGPVVGDPEEYMHLVVGD